MSLYDLLAGANQEDANTTRKFGVTVGVVTNIQDPDHLGRVRIKFPWLSDQDESQWARVATLMGGRDRGMVFLPEVDDEVLVAFEQGDMRRPYVIGALWNGVDTIPSEYVNDGNNHIRLIKSRSGHLIRLNDEQGQEKIEVIDKSGVNSITIDTATNTITIATNQDITLSAPQGRIKLDAQAIELASSGEMKIASNAGLNIEASATMNLKGATININ